MSSSDAAGPRKLLSSKCEIEGRVFLIDLFLMSNGCFISISENAEPRIGAITLSVRSSQGVSTSGLLPDKRGNVFSGMIGELLAEKTKGIVVASIYVREDLDVGSMKTLINEVRKLFE
jgi:hypothetical protein